MDEAMTSEYFLKKASTGARIPLTDPVVTVGRSEDNSLRLLEGQPSRNHAQLIIEEGGVLVEDLGSTNGTFVNGRRIAARQRTNLSGGDIVRFDIEEFEVIAPASSAPIDGNKTIFRSADSRQADSDQTASAKSASADDPAPREQPRDPGESAAAAADETAARKGLPGSFVEGDRKATVFMGSRKSTGSPPVVASTQGAADYPCLWFSSGEQAGQKIELKPSAAAQNIWKIGSADDCDIKLNEAGVSSKHAVLRHENGTWRLTDDLSVNGTFVNDKRILKSFLSDGDQLRFGPVECVFHTPAPQAQTAGGQWKKRALILAAAFVGTLIVLYVLMKFV
jgi:pSer/pThr/pTyr-binding forkhead associated (FHA) protein